MCFDFALACALALASVISYDRKDTIIWSIT
jgi:hypothetical protein